MHVPGAERQRTTRQARRLTNWMASPVLFAVSVALCVVVCATYVDIYHIQVNRHIQVHNIQVHIDHIECCFLCAHHPHKFLFVSRFVAEKRDMTTMTTALAEPL